MDGKDIAIMLHNRRRMESQILLLEHCDGFRVKGEFSLKDVQCHNIGIFDQYIVYNASARREFVAINKQNGKELERISFTQHTKGLASDKNRIYIGLSDYTDRSLRSTSSSSVAVLAKNDFRLEALVPIEVKGIGGRIGNINEIRALHCNDQLCRTNSEVGLMNSLCQIKQSEFEIELRRKKIKVEDIIRRKVKSILMRNQ